MKTDALRYLADALSEDIAATPEPKILAEERDDSAQRPQLALAFEELLADAKALARKRGTLPGISRADALGADAGTPLENLLQEAPENFEIAKHRRSSIVLAGAMRFGRMLHVRPEVRSKRPTIGLRGRDRQFQHCSDD